MNHLRYVELADFTGGLHTRGDWLVPPNAAAQLLDCYPLPQGGLRAFFTFAAKTTTGLVTSENPVAFYARGGVPLRDGSATEGSDLYLLTMAAGNVAKLYRLDETVVPTPTSWTLIKTFVANATAGEGAYFTSFTLTSGTTHVYLALTGSSADAGVWRIQYSDGVMTQIRTGAHLYIGVHQARLLIATAESSRGRLRYSDPGSEIFGANSFLDPEPWRAAGAISWFHPYGPSDLVVAREDAPFIFIQGDINAPIVRQMGDIHFTHLPQIPSETDGGLAFLAHNDGVYLTQQGALFDLISDPLQPSDVAVFAPASGDNTMGNATFLRNFLFTPTGYVWDQRTKAWFRTSSWSASDIAKHLAVDRGELRLYVPRWSGTTLSIVQRDLSEGSTRAQSYTYRSPPLRDESGRQLCIREVQVILKSYASGASCAVTVGPTTRTISSIASGRQKVSFFFREIDEVLDVQVVPNSNAGGTEAPSVEVIRVGTYPVHLTS